MLVQGVGLHPNAAEVARSIWAAHLRDCGILRVEFAMCVLRLWTHPARVPASDMDMAGGSGRGEVSA